MASQVKQRVVRASNLMGVSARFSGSALAIPPWPTEDALALLQHEMERRFAETLFGAEAGFDVVGETWRLRATAFRNSVDHVITNVTILTTPSLITKERENASYV